MLDGYGSCNDHILVFALPQRPAKNQVFLPQHWDFRCHSGGGIRAVGFHRVHRVYRRVDAFGRVLEGLMVTALCQVEVQMMI